MSQDDDAAGIQKSRYAALIEKVFLDRYSEGATEVPFERTDLDDAARAMSIRPPKNLGDVVYSLRYRASMPQSVLARIRYNRVIDVFLGITSYSLQNHLRTTVKGIGQIEIDELYVGIDSDGREYVMPVQAKGRKDQLSPVQTRQDIEFCADKFPDHICRPISAQFLDDGLVAMFELSQEDEEILVVAEKHYRFGKAVEK